MSVRLLLGVAASLAVAALAGDPLAAAAPLRPLETAFVDPEVFTGPDADLELDRAAAAGASVIKVPLFWDTVAPATKPAGFDAANPADPAYEWSGIDRQLRLVTAHRLTPLVYIAAVPSWAKRPFGGIARPDPAQFGTFALAAVKRYSGATAGVPRVRYWQAWNEPNKVHGPEYKDSAAPWYRKMVNAFAPSVHSRPGNFVVAGALAPFGISTVVAPLAFTRSLLCVSEGKSPHRTCRDRIRFDIWSTHPYTAGGPTHQARRPDDVSLGDLPEMKAVVDAGVRAGNVVSKGPVRFWVTEFSWDSKPPDPAGVPAALEARWVAEAMYRMWQTGVSLVTWYTIRDRPIHVSPYQSGLYFGGSSAARDRPKPALTAFRFPFVAFAQPKGIRVWGRTPSRAARTVVVEQRAASGWRRVATLRADRAGIFSARLDARGKGALRARVPDDRQSSLGFSLLRPPDRVYQPFGT